MDTKTFKLMLIVMISQLIAVTCYGQLYMTRTGETSFFSETPLENIAAVNKQVLVILNTANGEIAIKMQQRGFHFPNKLMEEHFNENYMETEKYPAAVFTGKIKEQIDYSKDGSYEVSVDGIIDMHGVKQNRTLKGQLVIKGGQIIMTSDFDVKLADHKIEVPNLVIAKIAEAVAVKNRFVLLPKKST
ncbi:YceI-like domain-containing protein [Dyadobacter koreensis]|uniref:YceI-like domain-containing protein n=1 Tax=Dyadobacter koreensis TaxID=408657 RepID=A0A1H6YP98_9BACT|nr:YceI family protein [Dyadobacter koreensis]SEJ40737.1 YceI-like domain-containing protein [Dyadobacter koreensis]